MSVEGLPSLLALRALVVVDRQAAVDHVRTEGRSLPQQRDGVLLQLALSDGRVEGLTDADQLLLAHQLLEAPAVVPLDVGLRVLEEAVLLELTATVEDLVADTAGVLVPELVHYPVGARWPTLLHVPLEIPLGLEELVAAWTR